MNIYSRQFLRERYIAAQQTQMAKDAELADPALAYQALIEELNAALETDRDEPQERAA